MGWIIFGVWIVLGIIINICMAVEKETPEEKKSAGLKPVTWVFLGIAMLGLLVLILYGLGWVWYYFCGGAILFEDVSFASKLGAGFASLVCITTFIGLIAILLGWSPVKR